MTKKKIYISGKITRIENKAPVLFEKAEKELQAQGYEVINPMKLNHNHDKSWQSYMKEDIKAMCDCDAIYMLNNSFESKGALIELRLARQLEMKIIYEN